MLNDQNVVFFSVQQETTVNINNRNQAVQEIMPYLQFAEYVKHVQHSWMKFPHLSYVSNDRQCWQ